MLDLYTLSYCIEKQLDMLHLKLWFLDLAKFEKCCASHSPVVHGLLI